MTIVMITVMLSTFLPRVNMFFVRTKRWKCFRTSTTSKKGTQTKESQTWSADSTRQEKRNVKKFMKLREENSLKSFRNVTTVRVIRVLPHMNLRNLSTNTLMVHLLYHLLSGLLKKLAEALATMDWCFVYA